MMAQNFPYDEISIYCFLKWSNIQVICRYGTDEYLLRCQGREFHMSGREIYFYMHDFHFIESIPNDPVRLDRCAGKAALDAHFYEVPFGQFLQGENFYQGYLYTRKDELLNNLAQILYPKARKFKTFELVNAFFWFSALKKFFAEQFRDFFVPMNSESSNALGYSPTDKVKDSMNAQIRALTKGDITKEQEILNMDTWRALTELNAQAREYQEITAKYGK
jgi:hypothetical protein